MTRRRSSDGELRPLLRRYLPRVHWTTVESGALAPGTPDVEGCFEGTSFWVECKWTAAWAVRIRPEQIGWHLRRARARGRSFILTRRQSASGPRSGPETDELWLHPGAACALLQAGGLKQVDPLHVSTGGPSSWDWDAVLCMLAQSPRHCP